MRKLMRVVPLMLAGWGWPCLAAAQSGAVVPTARGSAEREKVAVEQALIQGGGRGGVIAPVETRITPGKPYSAEAITESLQVLGDGNRISKKSVTRVYRDNEGRTRREQLGADGTVQAVTITDPVGGASYTLNPATKTASQSSLLALTAGSTSNFKFDTGQGGGRGGTITTAPVTGGARARGSAQTAEEQQRQEVERARGGTVGFVSSTTADGRPMRQFVETSASGGATSQKENLGEQTIEGLRATGTRTTTIIPAGSSIGNLNEIKIVSEQWFSPDLDLLVLTKHSDPRVGDTVYKLTNVVRAQPDANLFVVPPDYTLNSRRVRLPE
jgi:hypothetical protein